MKKLITLVAALVCASTAISFAHGGGLDQNGGHRDNKNGGYHFHR